MPRCLTEKPTVEWDGSTDQVPAGTRVVLAVEIIFAPSEICLHMQLSHRRLPPPMAETGGCMYLSKVRNYVWDARGTPRAGRAARLIRDTLVSKPSAPGSPR